MSNKRANRHWLPLSSPAAPASTPAATSTAAAAAGAATGAGPGDSSSISSSNEWHLPYGGAADVARYLLKEAYSRTTAYGASTALVLYLDSKAHELGAANVGDCSLLVLR